MTENNKMREMPVYKLMIQMGIPMILSMAMRFLQERLDREILKRRQWLQETVCFWV